MKGIDVKNICSVISLSVLVLLLLVGCVSSSSKLVKSEDGNDWVKFMNDDVGNVYSYKKVNIDKNGGNYIVQVLEKQIYSNEGREKEIQSRIKDGLSIEGYNKLSEQRILFEIDCKKRRDHGLSLIQYDKDGKVLFSYDIDTNKRKWSHVITDSYDEIVLKKVCE
ncbi:MAG: surface-adhesin E family protein [Smithella sp.]